MSSPGLIHLLKGITEAEASKRRKYSDPEDPQGPDSLLRTSVEELANPLTPVLGAGAGVSAVVGSISDSVLIAAVMLINALIGGGQRYAADQALHRLTESVAVRVRLRRPHEDEEATADNLVPGDVIELRAGDAVPADCRVLTAVGLEVDEASLTGESMLVTKSPAPVNASALADRSSMVYEGTTVAAGHGLAVVVAAGDGDRGGTDRQPRRGTAPADRRAAQAAGAEPADPSGSRSAPGSSCWSPNCSAADRCRRRSRPR